MTVSIILCTRNRAANLGPTIRSIGQVIVPESWTVELLVVDNGSSDQTHRVVSESTASNVIVHYLCEPNVGQVHARNLGTSVAKGEVILFTDDDVRVPPNWLHDMAQPILDGLCEAVQGGVSLAPHLERPWLRGALRTWVAAVENPKTRPEGLVGANMAFARKMLDVTGGFDPRLGPGAAGFYDDTVFGWAIERAGGRILYKPDVAVEHHFDPDRLSLGAFLRSAQRMAESRAIVMSDAVPPISRPSSMELLSELPGLIIRSISQGLMCFGKAQPDFRFIVRYYRICLWVALRRAK